MKKSKKTSKKSGRIAPKGFAGAVFSHGFKEINAKSLLAGTSTLAILSYLAELYKVEICFISGSGLEGCADTANSVIFIDKFCVKKNASIYSTFFHELGHIVARREGKFRAFHSISKESSLKDAREYKRTCVAAELYVDKWAEKEMKLHLPYISYSSSYTTANDKKWIRDNAKAVLADLNFDQLVS